MIHIDWGMAPTWCRRGGLASRDPLRRDDTRLAYALPRGRGGGNEATGHVSGLRLGTIPISAHRGRAYTGQDLIAETSFTGPLALPYEIGSHFAFQ